MSTVSNDLRFALRQLRKSPASHSLQRRPWPLASRSSAIFCLIDGLWLHPMPVPHQGELVRVFATTAQDTEGYFDYPDFLSLQQRATAFKGLGAIGRRGSMMPRPDGTSTLSLTNVVSSNFLDLLGVRPLLGRNFAAQDAAQLRARPGVVLSYRSWQRDFGGDPHIVGKQIPCATAKTISTRSMCGDLLPQFREMDANSDSDLWMPAESWATVVDPRPVDIHKLPLVQHGRPPRRGRHVRPGQRPGGCDCRSPRRGNPAHNRGRSARAVSDLKYGLETAGTTGLVLFAIVGGVVLLCTVNVAHLLLARALARGSEVALRLSLGATRWAVARQLLIENLLLCALGWITGLAVASALAALLPRLLVSGPAMINLNVPATTFQLDWRVFLLAGLLALATMLLLALVPLRQVSHLSWCPPFSLLQ